MGNFNFKSAGVLSTIAQSEKEIVQKTPTLFGIKTPLRNDPKYVFAVTTSLAEQVADNFRNLLLTNHGERLALYSYGANLRPLLSEFVSLDDFDSSAAEKISSAVTLWMPYITLNDFTSSIDKINSSNKLSAIKLLIRYDVRSLNIQDAMIEVILYLP